MSFGVPSFEATDSKEYVAGEEIRMYDAELQPSHKLEIFSITGDLIASLQKNLPGNREKIISYTIHTPDGHDLTYTRWPRPFTPNTMSLHS